MKTIIATLLTEQLSLDVDIHSLLETPKHASHGDIAFPTFLLAKERKQSPVIIAQELAKELTLPEQVQKVQAAGPYINFFFTAQYHLDQALKTPEIPQTQETILLEWPSPNSNKPLHIGHVRNMLMGNSLARILEKTGRKVIKVNLNNDRGIAICKSMLMYQLYGEGKTPESEGMKSDYFVGYYYTLFEKKVKEQPELQDQAQEMLQQWEAGDATVRALWEQMNNWAFQGHNTTYETFDIEHEKSYYESEIFHKGKEIVQQGEKDGLFYTDEKQNICIDLEQEGYGQKVLLRGDGTSIYITQDIALAKEKVNDFGACDKYIFVVGNEQAYHFQVLFNVLEKLGFGSTEKFFHFAYGMIELPEGKMSSRKGTVIYADQLIEELEEQAKENLLNRELTADLEAEELSARSKAIAKAALNFFILKFNPLSNFVFNPKESLSFEGETGPYLQYTYARIQSVLKKMEETEVIYPEELEEKEQALVKVLQEYASVVYEAGEEYKPSHIAHYAIKLAQTYNEFYHSCPIRTAPEDRKGLRKALSEQTARIIKDCLSLLTIQALDEM